MPRRSWEAVTGHRFAICEDGALLVVIFEGEISSEEERDALRSAGGLPGLGKDSRVLVDRRNARTLARAEDVALQMEIAEQAFPQTARPRMAVVAPTDHDFGMLRMLQLSGEDKLPHELGVFRTLEEGCEFLGVEPASLSNVLDAREPTPRRDP